MITWYPNSILLLLPWEPRFLVEKDGMDVLKDGESRNLTVLNLSQKCYYEFKGYFTLTSYEIVRSDKPRVNTVGLGSEVPEWSDRWQTDDRAVHSDVCMHALEYIHIFPSSVCCQDLEAVTPQ